MNKLHGMVVASFVYLTMVLVAAAQIPIGGDFRVNQYTNADQRYPDIAVSPSGTAVVVWESNLQDGDGLGIYARLYDSVGNPLGDEFLVNNGTTGGQSAPRVAMDGAGNFVIVWCDENGGGYITARRYDASGSPLDYPFIVGTTGPGQESPAIAMDSLGAFVIVWTDADASLLGIYGQRYDASGVAQGAEFRVNQYTTDIQDYAAVAMSTGRFAVVWESKNQDGSDYGIFGRVYNSTGGTVAAEFRVNEETNAAQEEAQIAMDHAGNFVVTWHSAEAGTDYPVYARRYDASGTPSGAALQVNQATGFQHRDAGIAMDGAGNFAISWHQFTTFEMIDADIYVRRYDCGGTALGDAFRANQLTSANQTFGRVGLDDAGNLMVVWQSMQTDLDVYGRRFRDLNSVADVRLLNVAKFEGYDQSGDGAPAPWASDTYQFFIGVELSASSSVSSAQIVTPGGATQALSNASGLMFSWGTNYGSKAELDTAFPTGTYAVTVSAVHDGVQTVALNMPADAYPPVLHVSNWSALQDAGAGGPITVQWDPIAGGSVDDLVRLVIRDGSMSQVYSSTSLCGTNVSVTIPGGTLQPGAAYSAMFMVNRIVTTDTNSYPGAACHVSFQRNTTFAMATEEGLFDGATDMGGGWKFLSWFGYFQDGDGAWGGLIWHAEHGWLYPSGVSTANLWLWSWRLNNWRWTSDTIYPFLWSPQAGAWLYYYRNTGNASGGWFYNFGTGLTEWR